MHYVKCKKTKKQSGDSQALNLQKLQTAVLLIPGKFCVGRHKGKSVLNCCGNDYTVERVGVLPTVDFWNGKAEKTRKNATVDRHNRYTAVFDDFAQRFGVLVNCYAVLLLKLDNLNERHFRYCERVFTIGNAFEQVLRQTTGLARQQPNENVRVEQVSHDSRLNGSRTSSL